MDSIARNDITLLRSATAHSVITLIAPRATGATHFAQASFPTHRHITLALPSEAARAVLDPTTFLAGLPLPVVIDDIQVAPGLIRHIAEAVAGRAMPPASFVLVGCRPRLIEDAVREAFGDAACLVELSGLSHAEAAAARPELPLSERIVRGGYPALYADPTLEPQRYLRDLVADHLVRDLPPRLRVDSVHDFERFLRAAAARTARLLNKAELAREIGIAGSTAAIWLDTLVEAGLVSLLPPRLPARSKPLVKSPKLYFRDTGLASHLLGIHSGASLDASPFAPALWETYVHAEIRRHAAAAPAFFRDRTKEANFVVPGRRGLAVLDASWSQFPSSHDRRRLLRIRDEIGADVATLGVVCRTPDRQSLRESAGPDVETLGLDDLPDLLG